MTESSQNKPFHHRPLRTILGSSIFIFYSIGPLFMLWCYYKAIQGSVLHILVSLIQIIVQSFTKKARWYMNLLQFLDLQLYFQEFTFVSKEIIEDNSKSLFAFHPHGIFSLGLFLNNHLEVFGINAYVCGSRLIAMTPIMGLLLKMSGMITVNADSLKNVMKKGNNIELLPGGFEEATLSTSKENRIFIKERKGFIKYAMRYGYKVYPSFVFGENKMYQTMDKFSSFRLLMNKLKLIGAIFWSKYGVFPDFNCKLHTVVGFHLDMPQIDHPTNEQVDKYHQLYIQKLTELYNEYAVVYNVKDELKIY